MCSRFFSLTATAWVLSLATLSSFPLTAGDAMPSPAASLIDSEQPLIIAHRGASHQAPENTLASFARALRENADLVELDYHHSADGVPVVIHDPTLDKTTDAEQVFGRRDIAVNSLTVNELQRLDAGSWFDRRFRTERIPTLEQAIELIQRSSVTLIEHKGGDAETCIALLREREVLDSVVIISFDWEYLADCHRLAPHLVLGALGKEDLTSERLDQIEATGASIVVWSQRGGYGPDEIEAIHDRGMKAWVYTVDSHRRATFLAREGIDGLITNRPGEIRETLSSADNTILSLRPLYLIAGLLVAVGGSLFWWTHWYRGGRKPRRDPRE